MSISQVKIQLSFRNMTGRIRIHMNVKIWFRIPISTVKWKRITASDLLVTKKKAHFFLESHPLKRESRCFALLSLEKVYKNKLKTLAEISQNKRDMLNVFINKTNFQESYSDQKFQEKSSKTFFVCKTSSKNPKR